MEDSQTTWKKCSKGEKKVIVHVNEIRIGYLVGQLMITSFKHSPRISYETFVDDVREILRGDK